MKRIFDLLLTIPAFLVLLPFGVVISAILSFTGEGEIFFLQPRMGKNGKTFNIIKFVTMLKDSPKTGTITTKHDPRVLPLGRYLRLTKLNEVPQIINIIKGDMSIVGPRPLAPSEFDFYAAEVKAAVKELMPGLTGMGSIVLRNEEEILFRSQKDKTSCYVEDVIPVKGELERWYFENRSFWVDLKIIVATAVVVFLPRSKTYLKWFGIEPLIRDTCLGEYYGF